MKMPKISPNIQTIVFFAVLAVVLYKTKAFGLLKPKGQKAVDTTGQSTTVITPVGAVETVPPLTASQAQNLAISFRDQMSEAWGFWGYLGQSPSDADFVKECNKLINLSDQQLAQVVNAYNTKYRTDTHNTIRKVLEVMTVTGVSSTAKKALIAKLDNINA